MNIEIYWNDLLNQGWQTHDATQMSITRATNRTKLALVESLSSSSFAFSGAGCSGFLKSSLEPCQACGPIAILLHRLLLPNSHVAVNSTIEYQERTSASSIAPTRIYHKLSTYLLTFRTPYARERRTACTGVTPSLSRITTSTFRDRSLPICSNGVRKCSPTKTQRSHDCSAEAVQWHQYERWASSCFYRAEFVILAWIVLLPP